MSGEGAAPAAVTFDYWNTLCCEPPGGYLRGRRLEAMSQVLVDAGVGSAGVVLPVLSSGYDAAWLGWNENGFYRLVRSHGRPGCAPNVLFGRA